MVVDGRKRIESRLTRQCRPPFGAIAPGDVIYIKRSAGPFVARAEASRILMADRLTPDDVDELERRYHRWIGGDAAYWRRKRGHARYATLIWLRGVQLTTTGPAYRTQHMRAWYALGEADDPAQAGGAFEAALTAGSLSRHYLIVRDVAERLPRSDRLTLTLDGEPTALRYDRAKQMVRGAALGRWLARHGLSPGDRVQFTPVNSHAFNLAPIRMND